MSGTNSLAATSLVTTIFETNMSLQDTQLNVVMRQLAAWAAIIAVPTVIASIYGMNFKHMPELDWIFGYPFALSLITVSCVVLYTRFKKTGWL